MKAKRRKDSRVFRRGRRYYADFRDHADVGGAVEALKVPGEKRATTDDELAETLAAQRLSDLQRNRAESQGRSVAGLPPITRLADWVRDHLIAKAKAGRVTDQWMDGEELRLGRAIEHFTAECDLSSIAVADVRKWAEKLRTELKLSGGTIRQHLNSLSNLYRRAQSEGRVRPGYNPVAAMMDKPSAQKVAAQWFEVPVAALVLEAARTYTPQRDDAMPFAYELIATALLTGGRPAEVLGLEIDDVSFTREQITFRPNAWRRLKTATSHRSVPLWPQLREILKPYVAERKLAGGRLLFPSQRMDEEAMLTDVRKMLDAVSARVGFALREVNLYDFRHTYCAARLQTLDGGAPVSAYTVGRELGHGGDALVKRVYGHLGTVRHRSDEVEYRVKQHLAAKHRDKPLREWVKALHRKAA